MLRVFLSLLTAAVAIGQTVQSPGTNTLSSDAIMARVAANQDREEPLRKQYLCKEHIRVSTRNLNGKLMREEIADYEIHPTSQTQLKKLKGRYAHAGKFEDFEGEPVPDANSWDADYIRDVRRCLTEDSRCTVAAHLFPFTSVEQNKYDFRLIGQEVVKGRDAYRIAFVPKNKDAFDWAGEALIDAADFQPVRVFTKLSRHVPFLVRSLGTDVSGMGYELDYKRQEDGNWFPASYGSEYELHLFFHIKRIVAVSMDTSFEGGKPQTGR
jgi:hypothetical protein